VKSFHITGKCHTTGKVVVLDDRQANTPGEAMGYVSHQVTLQEIRKRGDGETYIFHAPKLNATFYVVEFKERE
jgi:hypothetical protein